MLCKSRTLKIEENRITKRNLCFILFNSLKIKCAKDKFYKSGCCCSLYSLIKIHQTIPSKTCNKNNNFN